MSTKTRLEPQPPDLQPPWRSAPRVELQIEARAFAQDIVLPIADELDRHKAEMPRSLIDQMAAKGWFALPFQLNTAAWGLASSNTALSRRNLRALGFRSAASWRGDSDSARKRSTTPAGSNCFAARPRQMDRGHRAI
jgi:Acyl-CoA dehydrogenase, N-terminal domain